GRSVPAGAVSRRAGREADRRGRRRGGDRARPRARACHPFGLARRRLRRVYDEDPVHAIAQANTNIALVKYWGKRDAVLNLPAVGSISLTLGGLSTRTSVEFDRYAGEDALMLNGRLEAGPARARVQRFLDLVRAQAGVRGRAQVRSANTFPTAAGLASSASAFAALAAAATHAAGLALDPSALAALARRGSGSAARSVFGG